MSLLSSLKPPSWQQALQRLSPKQRQFAMLTAILVVGIGTLWMVFAFSGSAQTGKPAPNSTAGTVGTVGTPGNPVSSVTNIGIMPPGQQVNPVDQWVGTAGRKLAEYENERDEQTRLNKDRSAFEARTMQRFADLEQRLTSAAQAAQTPVVQPPSAPPFSPPALPTTGAAQGARPAGAPGAPGSGAMPPGLPPGPMGGPAGGPIQFQPAPLPAPVLNHIQLGPRPAAENSDRTGLVSFPSTTGPTATASTTASTASREPTTIDTFLPVSFTRGKLLGGLDAPTGGQSQSNPHPVLIRLSDNSVLPNRFRAAYRECFVIAAGYGDISSERAYLRTESLSCVRADGRALEVRIQGSVYGEDGKVGMRGRLVSKQGQMLANALMAGIIGGIGQGVSSASTTYSTSALGTIASAGGSEAYRAGMGSGVGRALDRLAQYYIKLAESTFPVVEIDAGREVDVVITKGVRIDVDPATGSSSAAEGAMRARPSSSHSAGQPSYFPSPDPDLETVDDDNY